VNCDACQEQLHQTLDGTDPADRGALDQHLAACADCRAYHDAARRMQTGLHLLRPPAPPAGLSARLVAALLEDRRRARSRARLRLVVGLAVAACVAVAVSLYLWPGRPAAPAPKGPQMVKPTPEPPKRVLDSANATPRQSMETAVEAVASLTSRTTTQTVQQTKKLIPLVEPTLPELPWEPTVPVPTVTLRAAGQGVTEGFEPVAQHARRAVGLIRRDLLSDF